MNTPLKETTESSPIKRRSFLKTIGAVFAVIWGFLTLIPIYRYLKPGKSENGAGENVSSVTVGNASEFPVGAGKNFKFGNKPAILVHTEDGQFHAFSAICTHLGCTVQFNDDKKKIWCACHGGQYDPETGKNIAGPPPKPLDPLKAEVVNGKIVVSRA